MEMHQVRYFLAVAHHLNFTRAADSCNVAQPSLTRAIKKLEEELGGALFRRERNRTHLTELGRITKPHLESIAAASMAAASEAARYESKSLAPLTLGVMCTIGPARMVDFVQRLRREVSALELNISEDSGSNLTTRMLDGELDLALIAMPSFPDRLHVLPLYDERYVVAFSPGHRFEKLNAVPTSEIDGEPYLQRSNCEFSYHISELHGGANFKGQQVYRSEREDWIQAMVAAGMGISILPEMLPTQRGIITRVLVEPEVKRTVSLVTIAGRRFSPTVSRFVDLARRYDWSAHSEPYGTSL